MELEVVTLIQSIVGFERVQFDDEKMITLTSYEQKGNECDVCMIYNNKSDELPQLKKTLLLNYMSSILKTMDRSCEGMDCSRTLVLYWCLHSLTLLGHKLAAKQGRDIVKFVKSCHHHDGGYGGGPGQDSHLAATYASVNVLCLVGTKAALESVRTKRLLKFLYEMRVGDGSFRLCKNGEVDLRGVYSALAVATLLNLKTSDLFAKSEDWIAKCQTYEGGYSCVPGMEAQCGYTFCAVASLYLLGRMDLCNMKSLNRWMTNRQTPFEGGLQGRTNKPVDSCYSFWLCASLAILNLELTNHNCFSECTPNECQLNCIMLREFLLLCCQPNIGGFSNKPNLYPDPYHTSCVLSGLTVIKTHLAEETYNTYLTEIPLAPVNPICNLPMQLFEKALNFFHHI